MKLRDYFTEWHTRGKIGTVDGAGFLIAGDLSLDICRKFDEDYKKRVRKTIRNYNYSEDTKERAEVLKQTLKRYIPLEEREIKETYPSIINDGEIVLIEGTENGRYWSISESEGV